MNEASGTDPRAAGQPCANEAAGIDRQIVALRFEIVKTREVQFVMPMLLGVLLATVVYVLAVLGEPAGHFGWLFGFWMPVAIVVGSGLIGLAMEVRAAAGRNILGTQILLLEAQKKRAKAKAKGEPGAT